MLLFFTGILCLYLPSNLFLGPKLKRKKKGFFLLWSLLLTRDWKIKPFSILALDQTVYLHSFLLHSPGTCNVPHNLFTSTVLVYPKTIITQTLIFFISISLLGLLNSLSLILSASLSLSSCLISCQYPEN